MVFGVVDNDHHAPPGAPAALAQFGQKIPSRHPIKTPAFAAEEELAIPQADGPKIANAFARGRMEQNWVGHFGRHPKTPPRAVLLKVNFVDGPEVNAGIGRQRLEFFYAWLVSADRLEPPPGAVCGNGNPTGERAAGIGEP